MTLDEYKQTCKDFLSGLPLEVCEGRAYYSPGKRGADRITLCRLHTLYMMARDYETANDDEPMLFYDHWWSLPAREELKYEVLNHIRA